MLCICTMHHGQALPPIDGALGEVSPIQNNFQPVENNIWHVWKNFLFMHGGGGGPEVQFLTFLAVFAVLCCIETRGRVVGSLSMSLGPNSIANPPLKNDRNPAQKAGTHFWGLFVAKWPFLVPQKSHLHGGGGTPKAPTGLPTLQGWQVFKQPAMFSTYAFLLQKKLIFTKNSPKFKHNFVVVVLGVEFKYVF